MKDRVRSWDDQVASSPAFIKVREKLLEVARPAADDDADLGAGTGFVTIALAQHALHHLTDEDKVRLSIRLRSAA